MEGGPRGLQSAHFDLSGGNDFLWKFVVQTIHVCSRILEACNPEPPYLVYWNRTRYVVQSCILFLSW